MSFSTTRSSQPGAGHPSLRDILSTVHDGSLGSDVHPLVLEAVVQAVLSESDAGHSAAPASSTSAGGLQTSNHSINPYWHLTKMPLNPPEGYPYQQWTPPSYDAFWSDFERDKATSSARSPLRATSQNTTSVATWSHPLPPQSHWGGSSSSYPSPAPSPESRSLTNKRKAASLEEMSRYYPALAEFIRVVPGSSSGERKTIDPFPCNRCHKTVGDELTAIRQHLVDVHSVLDRKTPVRCIFPGCEKSVLSGQMGSHIVTHQARDHARCGLCGKGFTRPESVVQHITSGICQIIKAADAAEDLQRRQKRMKHL